MRRAWVFLALAGLGCGGTLLERANSAIDTSCDICQTVTPFCEARRAAATSASVAP